MSTLARQSLHSEIVAQGHNWHLRRVRSVREPLLGAVVDAGPWHQIRVFDTGGAVIAIKGNAQILGPGHACRIPPGASFLYLPLSRVEPTVEWVLAWSGTKPPHGAPELVRKPPLGEPLVLPLHHVEETVELYPERLRPWLGFPTDVQSWATDLGILATSLSQRMTRLVGESPKRVLTGLRATIAFELAFDYRGRGASLAYETGYSSQAHLAKDIKDRFGMSLSRILAGESSPQFDWLKLVRSVVR